MVYAGIIDVTKCGTRQASASYSNKLDLFGSKIQKELKFISEIRHFAWCPSIKIGQNFGINASLMFF